MPHLSPPLMWNVTLWLHSACPQETRKTSSMQLKPCDPHQVMITWDNQWHLNIIVFTKMNNQNPFMKLLFWSDHCMSSFATSSGKKKCQNLCFIVQFKTWWNITIFLKTNNLAFFYQLKCFFFFLCISSILNTPHVFPLIRKWRSCGLETSTGCDGCHWSRKALKNASTCRTCAL